jgi:ribosomal protein S18 acetylase RimI-like enzyme
MARCHYLCGMNTCHNQPAVSRVQPSELPALQQISRDTFYDTFAAFNTPEDMQRYMEQNLGAAQLATELGNPDSAFYFARTNGEIAGYLKLNRGTACTDSRYTDALEIERIYVRKEFMGAGVGQALMDKAREHMQEMNLPWLWLGVWEKNEAAIRFYEKQGFVPFDSHGFMLGNDLQTDILMRWS